MQAMDIITDPRCYRNPDTDMALSITMAPVVAQAIQISMALVAASPWRPTWSPIAV